VRTAIADSISSLIEQIELHSREQPVDLLIIGAMEHNIRCILEMILTVYLLYKRYIG